jgi:hypothetical protein
VKTKFIHYLIVAASFVFISSCSDMEKSSLDNSLPVEKEKKEARIVKAKKKERKKPILLSKRKSKAAAAKNRSTETESTDEDYNVPVMNILADKIDDYAVQNDFSTKYCFFIDMSLPSGRKRFFVYDFEKGSVVYSGLVAHGSCNETFLSHPRFSNSPNCGCSSLGKYKVGEFYNGKYGKSIRLYGLDNSNSNAFKRGVVIHAYDCVPDKEIFPMVLCNSQGCPMVSYSFFDRLTRIVRESEKPIVLWVYK